ncbi:MAG: hypothetical protein HIU85_06590 [Proteobacteria bacterium]|nr:hypothetical protein [Pseudomonadota bacterium]
MVWLLEALWSIALNTLRLGACDNCAVAASGALSLTIRGRCGAPAMHGANVPLRTNPATGLLTLWEPSVTEL